MYWPQLSSLLLIGIKTPKTWHWQGQKDMKFLSIQLKSDLPTKYGYLFYCNKMNVIHIIYDIHTYIHTYRCII